MTSRHRLIAGVMAAVILCVGLAVRVALVPESGEQSPLEAVITTTMTFVCFAIGVVLAWVALFGERTRQ